MMNIEQLAVEHGEETFSAISRNENGDAVVGVAYSFTKDELEAFAKALQQQSEPVAWCIDDGFTKKILDKTPSDEDIATAKRFNWLAYPLYTPPPNTVSLEQYNKLLDLLERAQNGLKWYQDTHPEYGSEADDELHAEIDVIAEAERSAK